MSINSYTNCSYSSVLYCSHSSVLYCSHSTVLERILGMKQSVWKCVLGSIFLEMDGLIQAWCFSRNRVHFLQEDETKLSQRDICWIRATHFFMKVRIDKEMRKKKINAVSVW
ncbi:hypothetical protein FHG87_004214 [Trinorchestia longiramus]|nr:hypothetical protein FHG87_004214 [Trinorchestia longiramus]